MEESKNWTVTVMEFVNGPLVLIENQKQVFYFGVTLSVCVSGCSWSVGGKFFWLFIIIIIFFFLLGEFDPQHLPPFRCARDITGKKICGGPHTGPTPMTGPP